MTNLIALATIVSIIIVCAVVVDIVMPQPGVLAMLGMLRC